MRHFTKPNSRERIVSFALEIVSFYKPTSLGFIDIFSHKKETGFIIL
ncbi:hypothetical protein DET57_13418 [Klebsiella oxytoca]|uniref:Uncharacterized protein n=1 Tax=Klebsiella oxytoca TaxID=571 RepID=A0A318F7B0_KLEOX|nr:hypothetical protein DET57_13418 [Klebsiella oxytoca]